MYKRVGIIGGMGPAATCDLMMKIIEMTEAACDQEHIHVLVDSNVNIPDRTAALLSGGEDPVPEMLASARRLESIGADFLILPCNTAHCFIPRLKDEVGIPFLSMPDETAALLKSKGVKTAAVLATDGTVKSGLYGDALAAAGINAIYPDDEQQKQVMSLIYDYIKKGITDPSLLPHDMIVSIVGDLKRRGAEALLLACTELPLAFDITGIDDDTCVDPTRVLAAAAIREAGAKLRADVVL